MGLLLKDGVKYLSYQYKDEAELEQMVIDHYEVIFGKNAVLFKKQKISAHSGIGTIPDGFVLLIDERKWYVVEVELSTHPVYDHIVAQMSRFSTAIQNPNTRSKLIEAFYNEAKDDIQLRYKFEAAGVTKELYKFFSDTLANDPGIIIVIDEQKKDLDVACKNLSFQTSILEFKTFYREGVGDESHIHFVDTLKEYEGEEPKTREKKKIVKPGPSKGGSKTLMDVLDVITIVFDERKNYNEAVKIVASDRNVTEQTIMDHCTRRISINTAEFKALLEDKEKLISFLKEKFLKDEDGKIIDERLKRANSEEAII